MGKINQMATNKSMFRILYVLILSLNMIPIINIQKVSSFILAIILLWSAFLIVKDIYQQKRSYFKNKENLLPILFLIICFISCLINMTRIGINGFISFGFSIVSLLLLFKFEDKNTIDYEKELYWINLVFQMVLFVMVSISLYMFVFQKHYSIPAKGDYDVNLGFFENRLYGVFSSPNVGASYCVIGLFGIFINAFILEREKTKKEKVFYVLLSLFSLIYISKSGSRGAMLCVGIAIFVFIVFVPIKSFSGWKSFCFRGMISVLSIFALFGVTSFLNYGMNYIPPIVEYISQTIQGHEPTSIDPPISDTRVEDGRDDIDVSNKRFDIWKSHISLIEDDFLFGLGNSSYSQEELDALVSTGKISVKDSIFIAFAKGNTHNGYLNILVKCGLIALIIFLTIVITAMIRLFKTKGLLWNNSLIAIAISLIVYFLANNMMESNMVLMGANIFQAFFWIYAGLIMLLVKKHNSIEGEGK